MKRLKGAEVWTDHRGVVAIKTNGGDYTIYLDPNTVEIVGNYGRKQMLSTFAAVEQQVIKSKLEILNTLRKKK